MQKVLVGRTMMNWEGDVFLGSKATASGVQSQVFMALLFVCKSLLGKLAGKTHAL